ncbi:MAG: bifunctional adenosylcobinamide kinase/adenosylcobinamide-phosphate guanylyltransferase [Eubacteriales bacterium]|nr:bifunctional adenosylcobinamide kinase/adenosylcobinamide-phosphate guanylyltransferase [Eubacteriales bacterium]
MKFVIGGAFQGKCAEACRRYHMELEEIIDGADCGFEEIFSCAGIRNFHEFIRRKLEAHESVDQLCSELLAKNPQIVIVSTEIGYGIVPMEPKQRDWREKTGRISCEIAKASDEVIRVVAGIGTMIKGEVA